MTKTLQDWLTEGEQLYQAALAEYQSIEAQLDELEAKLRQLHLGVPWE